MSTDLRRGTIILSLFMVAVLTNGASFSEGLFYGPITQEFGFSRTQGATLASTTHLTSGIMLFFAGILLRKIPAQIMQSAGFLILASGYLVTSTAQSYASLLTGYFLIGLGLGTVALLVTSPVVVNNWFDKRKNLALATIYIGTSAGGAVITATLGRVLETEGWRAGYTLMALPMFAMPLLLLLFVRTAPPTESNRAVDAPVKQAEDGLTLRQGLARSAFWQLIFAFTLYMAVSAAVFLHFVPSLLDSGMSQSGAAARMSLLLLAAVPGKLLFGWLGDRIGTRLSLIGVLLSAAVALTYYASGLTALSLGIFLICFGLAYSAPLVLIPMALAKLVGRRNLSVFTGVAMVVSTIGWSAGPLLGGWLRDSLGSYSLVFTILAGGLVAAAILIHFALKDDGVPARQPGLNHAT